MAAGYVDEHKLVLYRDGAQPRDITAFASDMTLTDDLDTLAAELTFTTVRAVNTVVKGLPQSLCAMPRFGMTETTDMTALLAALEP